MVTSILFKEDVVVFRICSLRLFPNGYYKVHSSLHFRQLKGVDHQNEDVAN